MGLTGKTSDLNVLPGGEASWGVPVLGLETILDPNDGWAFRLIIEFGASALVKWDEHWFSRYLRRTLHPGHGMVVDRLRLANRRRCHTVGLQGTRSTTTSPPDATTP